MMYEYETMLVERDGTTLWVTLNRPDSLNSISMTMFDELHDLADTTEYDDDARVVVLTGSGRGFCSGLDLEVAKGLPDRSVQDFMRVQEHGARTIEALCRMGTPLIAAVNGPAAGGGLALALAADIRIATDAATFATAFIRLGLSGCDVGVSWLLPRTVGLAHASELLLTGQRIDAAEAERIGLINRRSADLRGDASSLAAALSANSPFGLRLTKQTLRDNVDAPSLQHAMAVENRNQVLAGRTADMREATASFMERRPPTFANE